MDKQQLMKLAQSDPRFQQGAEIISQQLAQMGATPEMLQELATTLEYVLEHPDQYPQVRAAAIQRGFASEQDIPAEFDVTYIISLLLAIYAAQAKLPSQPQMARGGLAQYGRGGDTELAHINPMEAEVLRRMGGSGGVNPVTGVREFKSGGLGAILSMIVPVALDFFAPGVGTMLTGAIGTVGKAAVMGGLGSALGGGNFLQGATVGALGAGLGSTVGKYAGDAVSGLTGSALSEGMTNALGNTLVGGLSGAAQGTGFGQGALSGLAGSLLNQTTAGMGDKMSTFGKSAGNLLTSGADPRAAIIGGGLASLATSLGGSAAPQSPSERVVADGLSNKYSLTSGFDAPNAEPFGQLGQGLSVDNQPAQGLSVDSQPGQGLSATSQPSQGVLGDGQVGQGLTPGHGTLGLQVPSSIPDAAKVATPAAPAASGLGSLNFKQILSAAPVVLSMLGSAKTPAEVGAVTSAMSPQQQEYFNRASQQWDWGRLQADAAAQGLGLGQYMAANWDKITAGNAYVKPPVAAPQKLAEGGLSQLARGGGSGRDDTIAANLSDGEYVFDAESVALLGDGSTEEGARRLEEMRQNIRKHKGKLLSRGKISPDAKSPLAYLKGVA